MMDVYVMVPKTNCIHRTHILISIANILKALDLYWKHLLQRMGLDDFSQKEHSFYKNGNFEGVLSIFT